MEKFAVGKNKRISIYKSIQQEKATFYHLNCLKRSAENNENTNFSQNARNYILNAFWKWAKIFDTMAHLIDNISVLGQTGCGKISFVQSLGKNKIFGSELLSVDWVSIIDRMKLDNVFPIQR